MNEPIRMYPRFTSLPINLARWGQDTTRHIYKALGLKGTTLPEDLAGDFVIDGFRIKVKPATKGSRKHRVCLNTGKRLIPVGRAHQAILSEEELNACIA